MSAHYVPHGSGVEEFFAEVHGHALDMHTELHHPVAETAVMNADGSLTTASGVVVAPGEFIVHKFLRPYTTNPGLAGDHDDTSGADLEHTHDMPVLLVGDVVAVLWLDMDVHGHGIPWVVAVR